MTEKKEEEKEQYYNVVMEVLIPATVRYRVFAKNPEEALKIAKEGRTPLVENPKLNIFSMKRISAKVLKWGTLLLELTRRF